MKRIIVSILTLLMISILTMFIGLGDSLADEVVFCVSQEEENVALMDAKGLCTDGENEYVISGSEIKRSENLIPLVVFSNNKNCDEASTGTTTRVGFDKNGDGTLSADEIMAISGTCIASVENESEDLGKR